MGTDTCVIRNFCPADLDRYVLFYSDAQSICHSDDILFLASLTRESPEQIGLSTENLLLAEKQNRIVGACRLLAETAVKRAVLRLTLAPHQITPEISNKLLIRALARAGELKVTRVHADLREIDQGTRDVFSSLGFMPVRHYSEMTLNLDSSLLADVKHENLSVNSLKQDGEKEFTQLQNNVFDGSWGFCPNTTNEIVQLLNTRGYSHDGVIITYFEQKAIGYCWTATLNQPDPDGVKMIGRIHMMGIIPEFRGQGLGKYILSSGLDYLAKNDIRTVELTVDNENLAACSLYKNAGFKLKTAIVWYEKRIPALDA